MLSSVGKDKGFDLIPKCYMGTVHTARHTMTNDLHAGLLTEVKGQVLRRKGKRKKKRGGRRRRRRGKGKGREGEREGGRERRRKEEKENGSGASSRCAHQD